MRNQRTRAFTLVELAALTVAGAGGAACFVAMGAGPTAPPTKTADTEPGDRADAKTGGPVNLLSALARARASARQLKDSTQARGIMQSLVIFAQNNKGSYPLPSALDAANATISLPEPAGEKAAPSAASKDTTANILSILIFNGMISPELCVSPAESNKRIKKMEDYQFTNPAKAAKPADALWDPGFSADFTKRTGGNVSYAHLQPSVNRRKMWADTFSATEAILGNRAPHIDGVSSDDQGNYTVRIPGEKSNTYRIHGDPKTWEGNIAFNDGHVNFETSLAPRKPVAAEEGVPASSWATYAAKDPTAPGKSVGRLDCWFYDEPDDSGDGANIFLGMWVQAGEKAAAFKGIWD
ncbi:MAG: hypothetical protein IT438_14550 [Phycisphaerales bacterium]|nr:hypothetical protein [Phycisphaerales bacterium]